MNRIAAIMGVAAGVFAAENPLMTDVRFTIGIPAAEYAASEGNDRFSNGIEVAAQFLWSRTELVPTGSWFIGGQAAFAEHNGGPNDFSLSTVTAAGLAGYAISPQSMPALDIEIGLLGGLGGAIAHAGNSTQIAPWLEGGLRTAAIVSWEQLQVGIELGYRLGLTHIDAGTGSAEIFLSRGIVAALAIGIRIE